MAGPDPQPTSDPEYQYYNPSPGSNPGTPDPMNPAPVVQGPGAPMPGGPGPFGPGPVKPDPLDPDPIIHNPYNPNPDPNPGGGGQPTVQHDVSGTGQTVNVQNGQTDIINGSEGNDQVTLSGATGSGDKFIGNGGSDTLVLDNTGNLLTVDADGTTIVLGSTQMNQFLSVTNAGTNTVQIPGLGNYSIEFLGTDSNQVTLTGNSNYDPANPNDGAPVNLNFDDATGQPDTLTLGNVGLNQAGYKTSVAYLNNLTGSDGHDYAIDVGAISNGTYSFNSGDDIFTVQGQQPVAILNKIIDMGDGTDTVSINGSQVNDSTITDAENISLSGQQNTLNIQFTGNENNTLNLTGDLAESSQINMGDGVDTLNLSTGLVTADISGVENIVINETGSFNLTGTAQGEAITLGGAAGATNNVQIDLGSGNDTVTLVGSENKMVNLSNVEQVTVQSTGTNAVGITGSDASDTVVVNAEESIGNGMVNLGNDADTLNLTGDDNIDLGVTNVETILMNSTGSTELQLDNTTAETIVYNSQDNGAADTLQNFDSASGDKISFGNVFGTDPSKFNYTSDVVSYDADGPGAADPVDVVQVADAGTPDFILDVDHVVFQG